MTAGRWTVGPFPGGMNLDQWRAACKCELKRCDAVLSSHLTAPMIAHRSYVARMYEALTPHNQSSLL